MTGRPESPAAAGTRGSVLVVAPTPFFADRGCHVRIYEEVQVLRDQGYRVVVCTYHHGRDMPGVITRRTVRVPWYRKLGPGPSIHKFYVDAFLFLLVAFHLIRERPRVVHAHLHEGVFLSGPLAKLFRKPFVADLQGSLTSELADYEFAGKNKLVYRILMTVETWTNRMADQIIVSSERLKTDLVKRFRIPEERITLVKDGVGKGFFDTPAGASRARWGIPEDHRVVVFLGVLTQLQGMEILMDAIPRVLEAEEKVTFLVIGFPGEDRFRAEAERLGFGDRVVFTGRMDYLTIAEALAISDLAISPKISETEGNGKLFNYMAAGLGTVVFDNPVNREILGDLGLYVSRKTGEDFAEGIVEALRGEERVQDLGRQLRERALERSSWESNREVLRDVYARAGVRHGGESE